MQMEREIVTRLQESRKQRLAEAKKGGKGVSRGGGSGPQHECTKCGYVSDVNDFDKVGQDKVKCPECEVTFKINESVEDEESRTLEDLDESKSDFLKNWEAKMEAKGKTSQERSVREDERR